MSNSEYMILREKILRKEAKPYEIIQYLTLLSEAKRKVKIELRKKEV